MGGADNHPRGVLIIAIIFFLDALLGFYLSGAGFLLDRLSAAYAGFFLLSIITAYAGWELLAISKRGLYLGLGIAFLKMLTPLALIALSYPIQATNVVGAIFGFLIMAYLLHKQKIFLDNESTT